MKTLFVFVLLFLGITVNSFSQKDDIQVFFIHKKDTVEVKEYEIYLDSTLFDYRLNKLTYSRLIEIKKSKPQVVLSVILFGKSLSFPTVETADLLFIPFGNWYFRKYGKENSNCNGLECYSFYCEYCSTEWFLLVN